MAPPFETLEELQKDALRKMDGERRLVAAKAKTLLRWAVGMG